jgi:transposase
MSNLSIAVYFPFMRVKITKQTVHDDSESAMICLKQDLRYRPVCHNCQTPARTVHTQGRRRFVQDLNLASRAVWLDVEYRKVFCEQCYGVRVEYLSFCDAGQRVTHRLARYIHDLCRVLTIKEVAERFDLHPTTVKEIDKSFLIQKFSQTDYSDLRVLAIDEIALKKGHTYMTVVLDYLTGRVVWMGEGRSMETLDQFFAGMTHEQKAAIETVAMDMWEAYINRVTHHCPQAHIVFDFFHVVQGFGRVIDKIRRDEYLKASEEDREIIKGSRYLLLKNEENLTDKQRPRLQELLAMNETLNTVYILKDQLKMVYYYSDRKRVKQTLDDWCRMAQTVNHPSMRAFIKKLRFFEYGICNHADYPIGTSDLEGVNTKIKLIKRRAYGYHDSDYFALKVKQAFPGKKTTNFFR